MLTFVGLGLYDERSITIEGRDAIEAADVVVAETYTSTLMGANLADVGVFHDIDIEGLDRAAVEQTPDSLLARAEDEAVVFLVGGDPMVATTHVDLRLRAAKRGIETRLVHGPSIQSAVCGLSGLQNYRFGKATTLPFIEAVPGETVPASVLTTIEANLERDLHTLVYLDIKAEREAYLSASTAASYLRSHEEELIDATPYETTHIPGVVVARAGSEKPVVVAGWLEDLAGQSFGPPLHALLIPATLHQLEAEALETFAGASQSLIATLAD